MKAQKNLIVSLIAMVLTVGLVLNFVGCMNTSPVVPEANSFSSKSGPQFISLGKRNPSLNKIIKVSSLVTREDGGELVLEFKAHKKKGVQVKLVLEVPPESISEDAELTLSIDDEMLIANVDIQFGPHGITFSKPALLSVEAESLDLSGIDSDAEIGFYYFDPETCQWEEMEAEEIEVDLDEGEIEAEDCKVPHFSRYAVAWSN